VLTKEASTTTSVVEKSHDASNVVVVSKETLSKKKVIIFKSILFYISVCSGLFVLKKFNVLSIFFVHNSYVFLSAGNILLYQLVHHLGNLQGCYL
jgi:hypothetical protein